MIPSIARAVFWSWVVLAAAAAAHAELPAEIRVVTYNIHHGEGTDGKGVATAAINIRCLDDFDFTKVPVHEYDGRKA